MWSVFPVSFSTYWMSRKSFSRTANEKNNNMQGVGLVTKSVIFFIFFFYILNKLTLRNVSSDKSKIFPIVSLTGILTLARMMFRSRDNLVSNSVQFMWIMASLIEELWEKYKNYWVPNDNSWVIALQYLYFKWFTSSIILLPNEVQRYMRPIISTK